MIRSFLAPDQHGRPEMVVTKDPLFGGWFWEIKKWEDQIINRTSPCFSTGFAKRQLAWQTEFRTIYPSLPVQTVNIDEKHCGLHQRQGHGQPGFSQHTVSTQMLMAMFSWSMRGTRRHQADKLKFMPLLRSMLDVALAPSPHVLLRFQQLACP
jgi:hypothetical protein